MNDDSNLGLRLNYWRDSARNEVDLIISGSTAKPLLAIEFKSAERRETQDVKALKMFAMDYPKARLICLCNGQRGYKKDGIEFLPWKEVFTLLD